MSLNVKKTLLKAKNLVKKGDLDAAAQLFTAVLDQFPQNKQAAQGLVSLKSIRASSAASSNQPLERELQNLVTLFNQGHIQGALDLGQLLARRHPDQPLVHNVVGAAYKSLRHYDDAIASLLTAIRLQPDYAEAYSNLGAAYHDTGNYPDAIASYTRATQCAPGFFEAYYNLGNAQAESGNFEGAVASYTLAIRIKPDFAVALGSLLFQLGQICDWDTLSSYVTSVPGLGVSGGKVHPFGLLQLEDEPARHRKRSENYARQTFRMQALSPIARPEEKPERLRIGYFSADFHEHATMFLMAQLFELHSRDDFAVSAYSYGVSDNESDSMRRRLIAAVDEFYDVRDLGDREIAELCRSHRLDIAVDLKGYTQYSRLGIFGYRVAPVQVSYLGYPGTLATRFIDYIIADAVVIPEVQRDHYSEKIIYLPNSYQVNDSSREISEPVLSREEAGLPEEGFVFCCFNNNFKIGPDEFSIWMRLMQQVDGSVLWLLGSNRRAEENLRKQAQQRGVNPDRIVFASRLPHSEHLARHRLADLFLDTFNYNAHTTASDALWAGLPVVTRLGKGFAARVAGSLLSAAELTELITGTQSEYEALALELALDTERLELVKAKLATNRLTAPLFDTRAFTRHIEEAYQQAYQHYFDNRAADDIVVQG